MTEDDLDHVLTYEVSVSAKVRHSEKLLELSRRIDALIAEYDEFLDPVETISTELLTPSLERN